MASEGSSPRHDEDGGPSELQVTQVADGSDSHVPSGMEVSAGAVAGAVDGQPQPSDAPASVVVSEKEERERKSSRRDRSSDRSRRRSSSRDRKSKKRHRSSRSPRSRRRRSSSRDRDRRRRSSSRDRRRHRRRSSSRDRYSRRGRDRSPSYDRYRQRRSRYSDSDDEYGYVPRRRGRGPPDPTKTYEDPFAKLRTAAARAADPAEAARQMQTQQLRARLAVLQQQAASAGQAASRTRKENLQLYVGNLAAGAVSADMLRQLFESTMRAAFPDQPDPVAAVNVHGEGRYAFVELKTPDMATAALQLNGAVTLVGATLSIGRPSGYIDPAQAAAAAKTTALALARFQAENPDASSSEEQLAEATPFLAVRGLVPEGSGPELAPRAVEYVRAVCEKLGPILQVQLAPEKKKEERVDDEEPDKNVAAGPDDAEVVREEEASAEVNATLKSDWTGAVLAQFLEHRAADRARTTLLAAGGGALVVEYVQPSEWIALMQ